METNKNRQLIKAVCFCLYMVVNYFLSGNEILLFPKSLEVATAILL
jgi:hypothetical protein